MNFKTGLLPQQIAAVEKLKKLKVGALFMEMGTGKTRTALELIDMKMDAGKFSQVLWLCPCSVKENLKIDIEKHTVEMPGFIEIAGIESISSSGKLYLRLIEYVKAAPTMLIIDESSLVKNHRAIRSERIVYLSEFCKHKLILNGTPITKNEADLFNQFFILDPRILGYKSYYSFAANHLEYKEIRQGDRKIRTNQVIRCHNTDYLAEKIAPYTYQVRKNECIELPEKRYHSRFFDLTWEQKKHYEEIKWYLLEQVDEFDSTTIYRLFTALQLICSGRRITDAYDHMQSEPFFDDEAQNPRLQCLSDLIDEFSTKDKVIIFAKYNHEIDAIMDLMKKKGRHAVEFTGRVKMDGRNDNIRAFQEGAQVMVANKRCGAYGLNLQFCHNIIFYSNDFDFATRSQAEDRIHRLGQRHECHIYDIIGDRTIDTMISGNLAKKDSLLAAFRRQVDIWKKQRQEALKPKKTGKALKRAIHSNKPPRRLGIQAQTPKRKKNKKAA